MPAESNGQNVPPRERPEGFVAGENTRRHRKMDCAESASPASRSGTQRGRPPRADDKGDSPRKQR